jgi:hypothetical protein
LRVGAGLVGEWVRIEERDPDIALFYAWKEIRCLPASALRSGLVL